MPNTESQKLTQVVRLFNRLFNKTYRTCLIGGAHEPMYQPASRENELHQLNFRDDYLSSALHEVAHWCIAGPERLLKEDFGYWYRPDGRLCIEQREFERVEVKPQALEWVFSIACNHTFSISLDNLNSKKSVDHRDYRLFEQAIISQCHDWCNKGCVPHRAEQFIKGLMEIFSVENPFDSLHYTSASEY